MKLEISEGDLPDQLQGLIPLDGLEISLTPNPRAGECEQCGHNRPLRDFPLVSNDAANVIQICTPCQNELVEQARIQYDNKAAAGPSDSVEADVEMGEEDLVDQHAPGAEEFEYDDAE